MSFLRLPILLCISLCVSLNNCGEVEQQFNQEKDSFDLKFHKAFETRRIKEKYDRNLLWSFSHDKPFIEQHVKVTSLTPSKLFEVRQVATWTPISDMKNDYLFSASDKGMNSFAEFDTSSGEMTYRWQKESEASTSAIPIKSLFFRYDQRVYLVVLYRKEKMTMLKVEPEHELIAYRIYREGPRRVQTITARGMADFDLVHDKGNVYLVLSTTQLVFRLSTAHESNVQLYLWKNTQFDEVAKRRSESEFNSVRMFVISSVVYITTTQIGRFTERGMENGASIFSYNSRENLQQLKFVQFIRTNSTKMQHFRVNGNNYLILIGSDDALVRWWNGQYFIYYQTVKNTAMAKDVSVMMLPHKEVILCFLFEYSVTFFSQITQSEFVETFTKSFTSEELNGVKIKNVQLHAYREQRFFAFFTYLVPLNYESRKTRVAPIWKLNLVQSQGRPEDQNPLAKCIIDLHQLMIARDVYLQQKAKNVDSVWVKNRKQTIIAPVVVTGTVKGRKNSAIEEFQIFSSAMRYSNVTNSIVHGLTQRVNAAADRVRNQLGNVVLRNRPSQVIEGRVVFDLDVNVETGLIGTVTNPNIAFNRIQFMDLKSKLLTLSGNQVISSFWTFKKSLWLEKLMVAGLVNKIKPNDILLLNSDTQIVTGNLAFRDLTVEKHFNLFIGGRLNGIQLNELAMVRKPQTFIGQKNLKSVRSANVVVNGLTNGVDFSHLVSKAVKLHSKHPQIIRGKLTFDSSLTQIGDLHTQLINQRVNITHMLLFAVSKSRDQDMFSPEFYCRMSVEKLNTRGLFNGLNLRKDLLTTNTFQDVYGNYVFNSDVFFRRDFNADLINGINLNTEAIRSYSPAPQRIESHKVFTEPIFVTENIEMDKGSLLDNVDPSDLPHYIHGVKDTIFHGRTEFEELVVTGNVFAKPGINNFVINDLPRKIWLKSREQVIPGDIEFRGPVTATRVIAPHVNGFIFPSDFVEMNSKQPQMVLQRKYFTDAIISKEFHTINGVRLNGVRLHQFAKHLFHNHISNSSRGHLVRGQKTFKTLEVTGNLIASRVNSLNIEKDVLLTNKVQIVNGDIVFTAPQLISDTLRIDGNLNAYTINGVSLSSWAKNVVLQSNSSLKTITNKIFSNTVALNLLNAKGRISGVDFDGLRRKVVTKNTLQHINVPLKLTGDVHFASLDSKFVNKVNFDEFKHKPMLRNSDLNILGVKTINGDVTIKGNMNVNGLVNGVDLNELFSNTAMKSKNNVFHSRVEFVTNVLMRRLSIANKAQVNTVLLNDLILLNADSEIKGKVVINGDTRIDGNLEVNGGVLNRCNLNELLKNAVWLNGTQVIDGRKTLSVVSVRGHVSTNDKKLNGIEFSKLVNPLVDIKSQSERLVAPIVFRDIVTVKNLILRNTMNGVDIKSILFDAVLKSKPQKIIGSKTFIENMVVNGHLEVKAPMAVKGTINGVDILRLNATALRKYGTQIVSGVKVFDSISTPTIKNMVLLNTLNGIRIPEDVATTFGCNISEDTIFKGILDVRGNVIVNGLLDRQNMDKWLNNRITLSGNEKFSANLILKNEPIIEHLFVNRRINDVQVQHLLSKSANYRIKRHSLAGDVFAPNGVSLNETALVNNVNIKELMSRRVDLKRVQFIPGTTVFKDGVNIGIHGIEVEGPLNDKNLKALQLEFQNISKTINVQIISNEKEVKKQSTELNRQLVAALKQSPTLDYFEMWREFDNSDENGINFLEFERVLVSFSNEIKEDRNEYHFPTADSIYFWRKRSSLTDDCSYYSTIVYKIMEKGDLKEQQSINPESRIFPPTYLNNNIASTFFLLTNGTCSGPESKRSLTVATNFNVDKPGKHLARHQFVHSAYLTDVKYFNAGHERYAITSYAFDFLSWNSPVNTTLYVFNEKQQRWVFQQHIPTFGAVSLDVVSMPVSPNKTIEIYLAIANRLSVRGKPFHSQVLKWNPLLRLFENFESIETWSPRDVLFIPFQNELYLVFANEKATLFGTKFETAESIVLGNVHNSFYTQPVSVYQLMGRSFTYIQSINVWGANTLERFYLSSEAYLVIGSGLFGETRVYKYRGVNNFQEIQRISTPGVSSIRSYWSQDGDLFLAIASLKAGHTKVLKAMITGVSPMKLHSLSFNTQNV